MEIRSPQSPEEFAAYFELRFEVLRRPWGEPNGSERDELEAGAHHLAAFDGGRVVAIGRLHETMPGEGQIRFMAVHPDWAGRGVGGRLLAALESIAEERGMEVIILNARENALGFYQRHGYEIEGEGPLLWGRIPHKAMRKALRHRENADA